ncbi:heparinase II/III domain-containing protein [Rhizobium leguminosarum]|uniref:heparinase II/III domain-containing protein n=1 Tax=Rhizobium leguminosarum TaxID=384 RepID=UPI00143FA7B6|nr:heparinase II/III family protein [Rhizobium leguminosarum]NKK63575.1 heparinase [Rhizobium leguminosarum bv. viciae]NKL03939.1 heparinase [Rhizobium leguminosarum bv. viciae]NKL81882.1 heparinase [Rhizobium leguminosarum bv. viciae]NKL89103.1 heparinase [Rhizobium leguminosarum bv. viciae]NKM89775.1 heparinase [Rhizobium leguminosarum bv. viciae]
MFSEISGELPDVLGDFTPGAVGSDRPRWNSVPQAVRELVIGEAEETLARSFPLITASDYREFTVTGNRARFEELYFTRRRMLNNLVLGELVEGGARFLPKIVDGIFLIAEESGWQLPAHNAYERSGARLPLPDNSQPVVDLFAAETAALLATIVALLRDELDDISPEIAARVEREIEIRILSPYLGRHFWWMGRGEERMNNWTAWISQNVLLTVFSLKTSQPTRHAVVKKTLGSLDAFLKDYAEDGACEEGVLYYRHAALCLHGALTILDRVAPGLFGQFWQQPKIRNMAEYIAHMHVAGRHYFNFADSSAVVEPCSAREYLFGQAVGSEMLAEFAAADRVASDNPHLPGEWNLWYRVQELLVGPTLPAAPPHPASRRDISYPGIGLFIARDEQFSLAVKGGNNGEGHNHNDVGSVTLYKNGRPFLIDVGVETYTAKTFSARRYEIWTMQSAFHNLPTFAGVMQSAGETFGARDVEVGFDEGSARISLDISGAYPPEAQLHGYRRVVSLLRGRHIEIVDTYDGGKPAVLSLMTCLAPTVSPDRIDLADLGSIFVEGAGETEIDEIVVEDARLRSAWPEKIYRLRVPFAERLLRLQIV